MDAKVLASVVLSDGVVSIIDPETGVQMRMTVEGTRSLSQVLARLLASIKEA